jgi:addiction module RelE/StbE family toxin
MEEYKIKIYSAAKRDLTEIIEYLNTLSPDVAVKYYDLIISNISSLSTMPTRCPRVRNSVLKIKGYRFLIVESYIVFFVIKDDNVQIRRIIYNKQNYHDIFIN